MSTAPTQTEAQRLAERVQDLSSMFKTPSHERGVCNQAAALLLRQDELLEQALEALEKAQHAMQADMGQDQIDEAITAIRAHREAK